MFPDWYALSWQSCWLLSMTRRYWFWPCSEWKYVLYDQDAFTVRIRISFTGVTVLYLPALFFYEQYSGLLLSLRGRGCLCSWSQNQGGVPFPPCVSRLPPSLHNSCTFALCSSFCTLYSHSQTQSQSHTAVVPPHNRPLCTTVETMTFWRVFSVSAKNHFEWIHSSLECDNWVGCTLLFLSFLCQWIETFYNCWQAYKSRKDTFNDCFDACCMGWVLCHRHLCSALECAGLAEAALILLHWLQLSHCVRARLTEQSAAVWEPQFWFTGKLP